MGGLINFIGEGDTEKAIHVALCKNTGRFLRINLGERDISRKRSTITGKDIYLMIDMDAITLGKLPDSKKTQSCIERLITNVRLLSQSATCENIYLLLQFDNLEEELAYACKKKSPKSLYKDFNVKGLDGLKNKIITSNDLSGTLISAGFTHDRMWGSISLGVNHSVIKELLDIEKVSVSSLSEFIDREL